MPPTYIQHANASYATTTSVVTTTSFSALANDVLVACSVLTPHDPGVDVAISNNGAALTWTKHGATASIASPRVSVWSTVLTGDRAGLTVTFTWSGVSLATHHGGTVLTIRDAVTTGAHAQKGAGNGAPTLNITPEVLDSLVVVVNGDYLLDTSSPRVWRTNAGPLTELVYHADAMHIVYLGYHANAGSTVQKAVGLSAPNSQGYAIAALEVASIPPSEVGLYTYTMGQR